MDRAKPKSGKKKKSRQATEKFATMIPLDVQKALRARAYSSGMKIHAMVTRYIRAGLKLDAEIDAGGVQ